MSTTDSTWSTTNAVDIISAKTDSTLDLGAPTTNITTSLPKRARQLYQMDVKTQDVTKVMECSLSTTSARSTTHVTVDSTPDPSAQLEHTSTPPLVSVPPLCPMDARILDALDVQMAATC
jgi:hypothetical protein